MISSDEIPLSTAAHQLGLARSRAYNAVLTGELTGRQVGNRWVVSVASLERAKAERARG
jgi:hypothetical protein